MAVNEDLESIYAWLDKIPLSRCKRNLPRDFADGGICDSILLLNLICRLATSNNKLYITG